MFKIWEWPNKYKDIRWKSRNPFENILVDIIGFGRPSDATWMFHFYIMEIIDIVNKTLKDDLLVTLRSGSKVAIAASCFSICSFQELKEQFSDISELCFIFTSPSFITEQAEKRKREFYIPRLNRERDLYGSEFEIKLRNELSLKAVIVNIATLITALSALITGFYLWCDRRARIIISIEPYDGEYFLTFENVGKSVAKDVKILIDKDFISSLPVYNDEQGGCIKQILFNIQNRKFYFPSGTKKYYYLMQCPKKNEPLSRFDVMYNQWYKENNILLLELTPNTLVGLTRLSSSS